MPAAYDTYDYPAYWIGRDYEHESEVLAIRAFLEKIPRIRTILEVGAGFGRLVPAYAFRAKKIILSDPSSKLLKICKLSYPEENFGFVQTCAEKLAKRVRSKSVDLAVCVRVVHHVEEIDELIENICRVLKDKGYLILEFANKKHLKATILQILKGNFTFPIDIFPSDKRSPRSIKRNTLPFLNYHPDEIKRKLIECDFRIVETRSVSNIRSPFLKKYFSTEFLISLERVLQVPLSYLNFGPSVFILAQKRPH
jgi:ubiquinone/menaquinone biosynthesis C-methylase UbiE